jgi:hypothetical protein
METEFIGPQQWAESLSDDYWLGTRKELAGHLRKLATAGANMDKAIEMHNRAYALFDELYPEGDPDPKALSAGDRVVIETRLRALKNIAKYGKAAKQAMLPIAEAVLRDYAKVVVRTTGEGKEAEAVADYLIADFKGEPRPQGLVPPEWEALPRYEQKKLLKVSPKTALDQDQEKLDTLLAHDALERKPALEALIPDLQYKDLAKPFIMKEVLYAMRNYLDKEITRTEKAFKRVSERYNINLKDHNRKMQLPE